MPKRQRITAKQLALKIGDMVEVTRDDGTEELRQVLREPWQLGHGDFVIRLDGIVGGYALERCKAVKVKPC